MGKSNQLIYATAILQMAQKDSSLLNNIKSLEKITPSFTPLDIKENASNCLRKLGFKVNVLTDQMISFEGSKKLFETSFRTKISQYQKDDITYFKANTLLIPNELQPFIKDVVFAEPIELF